MKPGDIPGRIFSGRHTVPVLLLMMLVLFVNRNLLKGGSFGSWDSFGGHVALISFFSEGNRALDMWNETSFGFFTPFNLVKLLALFARLSGDAILVFNVTIVLTMLGTAAGMYYFTYHFTQDRWSSFASAFAFTFNQWIVAKYSSGHLMHLFPYFLLPLLFFFLYKSSMTGKLRYIILFSMILSLYPFMRLDPLYYVLPFVMLYFPVYMITNFNGDAIKRAFKVALVSVPLFALMGMFLFLPVKMVPTMFASVEYPLKEMELNSLDVYNSILGETTSIYSNLFWGGGISWDTHPFLPLSLYKLFLLFVPALAFSALIFRRDLITVYFTLAALISVFLAKGPQEPFAGIYLWAYDNVPFFSGLHVPNRWLMITWFAYAFLAGIAVREISRRAGERFRTGSDGFRIFLIFMIFVSIFSGSYYVFTRGYETSVFPEQETEPHKWLMDKEGDFRLATVPFSQTYAFLEDGTMEQDLGKSSYYFHKEPVINSISGVSFNSRESDFPDFIENQVRDRKGDYLGKILGIYDVRFFVVQGYPPTVPHAIGRLGYSERDYFEGQKGLATVFEGNYTGYRLKVADYYPPEYVNKKLPLTYNTIDVKRPARILENSYRTPRIFAPQNTMLVVGGTKSFVRLAEIESFNFSEWNLLFADDLAQRSGRDFLRRQIMESDAAAYVNSEPLDLAVMISNSTTIKMNGCSGRWVWDNTPILKGYLVYGRDVIYSDRSGDKARCKTYIEDGEEYDIWVRAFNSAGAGELKVAIDGKFQKSILPVSSGTAGFRWVRLGGRYLNKGTHTIELTNAASGYGTENRLNGIVIARTGEIDRALREVGEMTLGKSVFLLDENVRDEFDTSDGKLILYSKNGPVGKPDIMAAPPVSVNSMEFKEIQPSKWAVKVNSETPYTLVFSNTYHPMWRAYVNGRKYDSVPSYYFVNSFQINQTGEHEVIIEFAGQGIQNTGLFISGLTYLGCLGYLFYDMRRKRVYGEKQSFENHCTG